MRAVLKRASDLFIGGLRILDGDPKPICEQQKVFLKALSAVDPGDAAAFFLHHIADPLHDRRFSDAAQPAHQCRFPFIFQHRDDGFQYLFPADKTDFPVDRRNQCEALGDLSQRSFRAFRHIKIVVNEMCSLLPVAFLHPLDDFISVNAGEMDTVRFPGLTEFFPLGNVFLSHFSGHAEEPTENLYPTAFLALCILSGPLKGFLHLMPAGSIHRVHKELALVDVDALFLPDIDVYPAVASRSFDDVNLFSGVLRPEQLIHELLKDIPCAFFAAVPAHKAVPVFDQHILPSD